MTLTKTGLFEKTREAEDKSKISEINESIKLILHEWQIECKVSNTSIDNFFSQKVMDGKLDDYQHIDEEEKYKISKNGYYVVIDKDGNIIEEITKEGPQPEVKNIKITTDGTTEAPDNSQKLGTKLQVDFDVNIEGGAIKLVTPSVPYTTNGKEDEVVFTIIGTVNGKDYKKTSKISLKQKYKVLTSVKCSDIANATDKKEFYGAKVTGYTPQNGANVQSWKIFYANSNNIYLIADDYIEREYLPASTKNGELTDNKPNNGSKIRSAYFNNVIVDYEGSSRIVEEKIKKLNDDYFNIKGYSSTNSNMKAIAYMLDTKSWEGFKDLNGKADYAIGGPTIEMLLNSYNQKYNLSYKARAASETGYQISKDDGVHWDNQYDNVMDAKDDLYVINNELNASAMWIASPCKYRDGCIMYLNYTGSLTYNSYIDSNTTTGFRPIICLNSDVTLQETTEGYKIK